MSAYKVMENIVQSLTMDQDYLQRKLDHYNKWLLDPSRPLDQRYPGFPEDVKLAAGRQVLKTEIETKRVAKAAKAVAKKAPAVKRVRSAGGPTKADRAVELYKQLAGIKADVIAALQSELGMSVAGATTYFYNAKKASQV